MEKKIKQKGPSQTVNVLKLEIVLKCDSVGSVEAATAALSKINVTGSEISIVQSGIGAVNKSDVLLAGTAGRLVIGFQVDVMPDLDKPLRDYGVQVRLYKLIYNLAEDLRTIAQSMISSPEEEQVTGAGVVIALFKGTRKGIIIGCEVGEGFFAVGQRFRLISAMGPVYAGTVESMHIGEKAVQKAAAGQRVGIRIRNFNKARIGDIIESFRAAPRKHLWEPQAGIIRADL